MTTVKGFKHIQAFIAASLSARPRAMLLAGMALALCACASSPDVIDQRASTDAKARAANVSAAALADQWYTNAVADERCRVPTPHPIAGSPDPSRFSTYRSPMVLVLADLRREPPAESCMHREDYNCVEWDIITRIGFRGARILYARNASDIAGLPSSIGIAEAGRFGSDPGDVVGRSLDLNSSLVVFAYYTDVARRPGLLDAMVVCELREGQSEASVLE